LTLGLIGAILAAILISFDALFTAFHHLFFTGDSWLFLYSDSLIRLFPLRLWQDGFIAMGILTAVGAVLFILAGTRLLRKKG
jgi:integral membrane protein (TIGR01906 family)